MIRANPSNLRLQHRLLTGMHCYSIMKKIESFDNIEDHDDFADWLLQTKLEESGFIVFAPTSMKTNVITATSTKSKLKS